MFNKINSLKFLNKEHRITLSFYRYYKIINLNYFFYNLYKSFLDIKVLGRVYIAKEGINAQISIPKINLNLLNEVLYSIDKNLNNIHFNIALDNKRESFDSLIIKIKKQIVADGIKDKSFTFSKVGQYLSAEEVNYMLDKPSTLLIDVRNDYEYNIGHFNNAINIPSNTFREKIRKILRVLKYQKNREIVLYCTGGIRCEKASSWMLFNGFKNVFQVKNGIIGYVNIVKKNNLPLKFKGKNFVFDKRLSEKVTDDVISFCHQCRELSDNYRNCRNKDCHSLFIQCDNCMKKYNGCCSFLCRKRIS